MTDAKPAREKPQPKSDLKKLFVLVGASAIVYGVALGPVMAAVRRVAAVDASRVTLGQRVLALAEQDRLAAENLRKAESKLTKDLQQEQSLRTSIATVLSKTPPPAPAASPTAAVVAPISVPTVNTTTGASGLP